LFFHYLLDGTVSEVNSTKPTSKLLQAIDVVRRYMEQYNFGIFDGSIYKKAPEAEFTFVHCSSVKDFVHYIMWNIEVADQIASHVQAIINLLSEKCCRLIKQLTIDYNFIEVLPKGTCFDIEQKKFVERPSNLKGIIIVYVKE